MEKIAHTIKIAQKVNSDRNFHLYIGIASINDLKPHEEIVPEALEKLSQAIRASTFLKNPIIVDLNSNVILDGMHRWQALKNLGYDYIGVCYVDYRSSLIKLGRWFRCFRGKISSDLVIKWLKNLLEEKSIYYEWINRKSLNEINPNTTSILLIREDKEALIFETPKNKKLEFYHLIKDMCTELKTMFMLELYYEPDIDLQKLSELLNDYSIVLTTPALSKKEVVDTALKGKVFPPKTTRHEIPARPMFLNFPLNLLKTSTAGDLESVNKYFRILLRYKNIVYLRPGLELDREYREDIILFWDTRVGVS